MSEFKVKPGTVEDIAKNSEKLAKELERISDGVYRIRRRLRFKIAQRGDVERRLNAVAEKVNVQSGSTKNTVDSLKKVAREYKKTELRLCGKNASSGGKGLVGDVKLEGDLVATPYGKDIAEDSIKKFEDEHSKELKRKRSVYDKDQKEFVEFVAEGTEEKKKAAKDEFDDYLEAGKVDVAIGASAGAAVSGALYQYEYGDEGDIVTAKVSLGEGEAHAKGYAGLYQRDPDTGEMEFRPGVGGEIGASFSAFTAEEKAEIGSDMLGAYAKSTQTIGRVGGTAEASAGLVDADGKFNPSLYAGASAEAIAGEITGAVGGKILGTQVEASGSLNYGIGAHAKVGYKDGKISLDVGATLGVGASASVEIDIGGTVKAIGGQAKAAWNKVTSWL